MAGAALGPWGAAAGGVIGGALGYFSGGGDDKPAPTEYADRAALLNYVNQGMGPGGIANHQAPQLQMGNDPFRRAQLHQLGQLQGIASGQQQGAGELAAQRQIQNALSAQQAQARMARGGNAALAYRNAANQSAALGSTGAGMGQQAALQDQMNAQGLIGQVGASGRQGDYSVANANAGYQQGTQQLNSQNYLNLMNQLQQMDAGSLGVANSTAREKAIQDSNFTGGLLNQAGQAVGAYAAWKGKQQGGGAARPGFAPDGYNQNDPMEGTVWSDERLKTDVTDGRAGIDAMLDGMRGPVEWRYKDPKHGEGRWTGTMAQDLERSEVGKRLVVDTPEGKALDVKRLVSANLAASVRLNERLRALEAKH